MKILGIHTGHDSSCAVVEDGKIIADVAEERFVRNKHSSNVPTQALKYCIKAAGAENINEFDYIAAGWKKAQSRLAVLLGLETKSSKREVIKKLLSQVGINMGFSGIKPPIYMPDYTVHNPEKFINIEHHFAHAASAHFTRNNTEKCLVFTMDGAGDEVSTAVWLAEGNKIEPLQKLYREAAIGWAYSIVTEGLHWWHGDGEGKTMGLAPYGDYTKCQGILDDLFPVFENCEVVKETNHGNSYSWQENGSTQFHFDKARDIEKLCEMYGRENIAAEAQRKLEETIMNYIFGWIKKTGIKRIACAGGIFLNVKLNQRIWNARGDQIIEQHIFPNCGDSGLAVGSALAVYYDKNEFNGTTLENLYWGPEYTNEEIEFLLKERNLEYEVLDNPSKKAGELLAEGKIVAWFQGRMESGPRALGNRSILMNPYPAENKDIINARVKFREGFRPFCRQCYMKKETNI